MSSLKRPKSGETEEDLLREQNLFLSTNKVQKLDPKSEESDCEPKIADNHDIPLIATSVVEKNVHNWHQFHQSLAKTESVSNHWSNGFPKAVRRSDDLVAKRGISLFAQQMNRSTDRPIGQTSQQTVTETKAKNSCAESVVSGLGLGTNDWKSDINRIRSENELLIQRMDEKEIIDMRRELMSKLSPKTVDFLVQKKYFNNKNKLKVEEKTIDSEMSETNVQTIDEKDLPIKPKEVMDNKWLHMSVIEKEKLSWMGDIADQSTGSAANPSTSSTNQTSNARFDFDGRLIERSIDEIGVQSGLYHHQSDESSAGYTTQELYTLIQSTFSSQKVLGLQVLAKLLTRAYNGLFDQCFNENLIEQLMKDSALVLVTRLCLDDSTETVWRAAINALHAMLCNTSADELFLDRGFTLFTQCLPIDSKVEYLKPSYDSTKLDELSDKELMRLDAIECLVKRTSLLQRIRYLLEFHKTQLDLKSVNHLLDVLIRIARHSSESRQEIIKCPYLLETIVQNLIPVSVVTTNAVFDKPNAKAMKLIRLLTASDSQTSLQILNSFPQLIEALKVYLTLNPENCANSQEVLELSIESLRVWIHLLPQKVFDTDFVDMFPIVIKQLQFCSTLDPIAHQNNFDFQYASTLIFVVKILVENNKQFFGFNEIIFMTAMKWLSLINNTVIVPNFDANLCVLSAVQFLLTVKYNTKSLQEIVSKTIDSQTLSNKITLALIENSNLVKLKVKDQGNRRDSSNLPSFGSVYYRSLESAAILNNESPICLLLAIINVMKSSTDAGLTYKWHRLNDYVFKVSKSLQFEQRLNLFDSYELNFVTEICLLCSSVPSVAIEDIDCYINVSILAISFMKNKSIKQNLLNRVVFNKAINCLSITENIAELSLRNEVFDSNSIANSFDSIKALYEKYSHFDCHYWVFDPILSAIKDKRVETQDMLNCFQFICFILKKHKNYFKQMMSSSSALFCLISSVFLVSEEIFFDNSIQNLLNFILKELLLNGIQCRIEDVVPYFETAGDFFVKFVDQFESVSYGNKLFVNYLLVFCQSDCSPLFRSKLFSDYITSFRIINIGFEEILTPIENFLFPIEKDCQTLESYLKALLCGALTPKESPILYLISVHHLNHNLFRSPKDISKENNSFDRLIRSVHNSSNALLKHHLLEYSHFDAKQMFGISLKSK